VNIATPPKQRFLFIDQFRGFIGVLMLLGHSSYYFNAIWHHLDPGDPVFPDWSQFALRYAGYLCAPGFLMMNGAMVWWSYQRRTAKGSKPLSARWHLMQRGIFLVLAQMIFVNAAWGGFAEFKPWHLGIISTIGLSMISLTLIVHWRWQWRVLLALALLIAHVFLLQITYNHDIMWQQVVMQTFIDSGDFNKYPLIPWLALGILGSVMANGWLDVKKTYGQRILLGVVVAGAAFALAILLRMQRGWGTTFDFSDFGTISFFIDQKYPPSLFMNLWSFAAVVTGVTLFIAIDTFAPALLRLFTIPGRVPLFFYAVHLAILGIFVKRMDFFYREGGVAASLIGLTAMLVVMLPLCWWFYGVKRRSKNYFIQMI
jgi:uncharacterized membrane protein